nr:MAG TPA: hypothetical protein [Caudoviricetes sp.]
MGGGIVEIYSPNTLPQHLPPHKKYNMGPFLFWLLSPHKIFSKGSLNLSLISPTKIL